MTTGNTNTPTPRTLTAGELAAIREDVDTHADAMRKWAHADLGTDESIELEDRIDALRDKIVSHLPALLDHAAALAERVETLEAALRPFAGMMRAYEEHDDDGDMSFFEWVAEGIYKTPGELTAMFDSATAALGGVAPAGDGERAGDGSDGRVGNGEA